MEFNIENNKRLNSDEFNMFKPLTRNLTLYYDCSNKFITYQEKLRDWPVEASATSASQEGANSSKGNSLVDKGNGILLIQPSFLSKRGFIYIHFMKYYKKQRE